jgi:uncharacterized protein (TIGR00288 family)
MSAAAQVSPPIHAPNAALLIDFDNVTMGIRSDLGKELRMLLSSEIIRGKVAVQRAYADWRRYPQYVVPLTEASIDLIYAPAYGASKKNATDIRLAIDAMELVFTRPEIGTIILLSGDSDFSTLVIKLKEYGKYVIGVGIRESSSDLLVMNCDEYYSYNALAGLVKASDEAETARKYDPWELVTEAVQRMKRNNDVMRSDRLKQVMQEIDSTFDEKNLGISKFSRFCQEAAQRGLLSVTKLDNGQLEVDLPSGPPAEAAPPSPARAEPQVVTDSGETTVAAEERPPRRGRRGRGGRGREREERPAIPAPVEHAEEIEAPTVARAPQAEVTPDLLVSSPDGAIGVDGEKLNRTEAFDLIRRAVEDLAPGDVSIRASEVRRRARQLLGHDSESLSDRRFVQILKDAHDADVIDLRRRGNDFEVARAVDATSVAQQVAQREQAAIAASTPAPAAPTPRVGMGHRGAGVPRGRVPLPPELLSIGVVETAQPTPPAEPPAAVPAAVTENGAAPARGRGARGGRGRGKVAKATAADRQLELTEAPEAPKPKRGATAKKAAGRPRAKKAAKKDT